MNTKSMKTTRNMKGLNTMTTNRKSRSGQQFGSLKIAVAAGSLAAALLGTQVLARQDTAVDTAAQPEALVINVPISMPTSLQTEQPSPTGGAGQKQITLDLAPIPQAVVPKIQAAPVVRMAPITQTQSSR